jgi:hypothetical protein
MKLAGTPDTNRREARSSKCLRHDDVVLDGKLDQLGG